MVYLAWLDTNFKLKSITIFQSEAKGEERWKWEASSTVKLGFKVGWHAESWFEFRATIIVGILSREYKISMHTQKRGEGADTYPN